ncbi:MAG: hypothetical protein ACRDP7_09585, partial [Trebonia sp.]
SARWPGSRAGLQAEAEHPWRQARLVLVTQACALALVGVAAGIPLGLLLGQDVWRAVADRYGLRAMPP